MSSHAHDRRIEAPDTVCLSHLRWDFVFQRPQHLLTRCARQHRVFFIEEPIFDSDVPRMDVLTRQNGVRVVVPHLPGGLDQRSSEVLQKRLIDDLLETFDVRDYILWYYTPMALGFTRHLTPSAVVYDCMDELSGFVGAPPGLKEREAELFALADVVFTGGHTLYESKRALHSNIHPFPSSVDVAHFARARTITAAPADQARIPRPRVGFFGVIDERMDIALLEAIADRRPDWHLVLLGPVVKIDPAMLPRQPNIHYLGPKKYEELPHYVAGWDVALLPFAMNDATKFISPTKTPEYLAAGRHVVSTPIRDVVRPYGMRGLARIAETPDEFVAAIDASLHDTRPNRLLEVDAFLAQTSWDGTWTRMRHLVKAAIDGRRGIEPDAAASASGTGVA